MQMILGNIFAWVIVIMLIMDAIGFLIIVGEVIDWWKRR